MATETHTRRAVLGTMAIAPLAATAVAATSTTSAWDAAYRHFQFADALVRASDKFGHQIDANNEHDWVMFEAEQKYGSHDRAKDQDPALKAKLDASYARATQAGEHAYDHHHTPANMAAIALLLIPAPTIEAINIKIAVATQYELNNDNRMPEHPFDLIEADVKRLAA